MNTSDTLEQSVAPAPSQRRQLKNAIWEPFLQFKLLMYMLGTTAVVAVLLGWFLYYAFNDLIAAITVETEARTYYGEMIEIQLVHLFRYCGALFVLYILLLASVCVVYTHRMVGPFRPFCRQVDALIRGEHSARVTLRKGDLELYREFGEKLNHLATRLELQERENSKR